MSQSSSTQPRASRPAQAAEQRTEDIPDIPAGYVLLFGRLYRSDSLTGANIAPPDLAARWTLTEAPVDSGPVTLPMVPPGLLTARQTAVLEFIAAGIQSGRPPTVREICARFGWKSVNAASGVLDVLERRRMILRDRFTARGIRLFPVAAALESGRVA